MKSIWILLILFLAACTPEVPDSTGTNSSRTNSNFSSFWNWNNDQTSGPSSSSNTNNNNTVNNPVDLGYNLKWYYESTYYYYLTVDSDFSDTMSLRGNYINEYLYQEENFNTHCMKISFNSSSAKPLVVRLLPYSSYQSGNYEEKYFRIDLDDASGAQASCYNTESSVVYSLSEVCPECVGSISTSQVTIYPTGYSSSSSLFDTSKISLKINMNNDTTTNNNYCTNETCQAQGYDCCLEGQCVNNATVKSSAASANPEAFSVIYQIVNANPNKYADYPEYYYICPSMVGLPTDDGSSDGGSTDGGSDGGSGSGSGTDDNLNQAQQNFQALVSDYYCVKEMKDKAIFQPFHENPINEEEDYESCIIDDDQDPMYFEAVLSRLYTYCGCAETEIVAQTQSCPNYELQVKSTDTSGNPTEIICYTPPVEVEQPFQNLTISVNSRSAPHRFFTQEGENYHDLSSVYANQEIFQEGDPFIYQDTSKTMPVNGSFNMNSILGQMSVNLDQTLPATKIDVTYDDVYIIATTSGYYTPCPTCARDSWFSPFTSNPPASYGVGAQAVGFTTSRDTWGNNSSYGNYEDTIFGRACWLPPTMIPFSHAPGDDALTQRLARLQTQASMFVNGYQRDWFGFNKGALIGSFDGVTWFAVGKGRIVRATSDKLFLAINAPFADLAEPTNHNVSIRQYEGVSSGAIYDYDPNLTLDHPSQNEAASCQQYHSCETDTECITKLGWEYVCSDVKTVYTSWPRFDTEANELEGEEKTGLIEHMLQQGALPSGSSKRCVYRGAGAPCRKDYESISNVSLRKNLACAPNFYCASLTEEVFNSEVARFTGVLESLPLNNNHLFGQDANVLARPLHYVTATSALPEDAAAIIAMNMQLMDPDAADNEGLCRPGKALPSGGGAEDDFFLAHEQHKTADEQFRTDYISQIGGCNSADTSEAKYVSCPIIDDEGNLAYTSDLYFSGLEDDSEAFAAEVISKSRTQNSCGGESYSSEDTSPFSLIEAANLAEAPTIVSPTFAMDACFRRAGSVCHTDMDCSPNKVHRDNAQLYTLDYFGNVAEQKYWEEYLVCGQAQPQPGIYDAEYKDYDMSKNRCCREIGNDITIYSEKTPGLTETDELQTKNFSYMAPNDPSRYSRFSVADDMENGVSGSLDVDGDSHILTKLQWKAVGQVASRTCCGGGWVRKFADGTNNWAQPGRLSIDVSNFKCINYKSPLIGLSNTGDFTDYGASYTQAAFNREYTQFCSGLGSAEGENGCLQSGVSNKDDDFAAIPPSANAEATEASIIIGEKFQGSEWAPYPPMTADAEPVNYFDFSALEGSGDAAAKRGSGIIEFYIPAYMGDMESNVSEVLVEDVEEGLVLAQFPTGNGGKCIADTNCSAAPDWGCKYCFDNSAGKFTVAVSTKYGTEDKHADGTTDNSYKGKDLHIKIKFVKPGVANSLEPGNYLYYLYKLSKLELIGIPQVHFEPMVCSNNKDKLVPGIFKEEYNTLSDLEGAESGVFNGESVIDENDDTNPNKIAAAAETLQHDEVFSSHEFMCCQQLGQVATSADRCCSGHAVQNKTTKKLECKLPSGTDLNVYFNRFVTAEGMGDDAPGGGFDEENDFDANTGAPVPKDSVYKKLNALGSAYCESAKTRRGGAMGVFPGEPSGAAAVGLTSASIVDSFGDSGSSTSSTGNGGQAQSGYTPFYQGYRWNHHIYCE